jgi:Fe2+ or Zn2+ uptake regulation protein
MSFEIGPIKIKNARFAHNAIVCAMCGCVVGIEEHLSMMYMLSKIAEKLGVDFNR